jgi:hypothetical protein
MSRHIINNHKLFRKYLKMEEDMKEQWSMGSDKEMESFFILMEPIMKVSLHKVKCMDLELYITE